MEEAKRCLIEAIEKHGVWSPEVREVKRRWAFLPDFPEAAGAILLYYDLQDESTDFFLDLGIDPRMC